MFSMVIYAHLSLWNEGKGGAGAKGQMAGTEADSRVELGLRRDTNTQNHNQREDPVQRTSWAAGVVDRTGGKT